MTLDLRLATLPPTVLGLLLTYIEKDPLFKTPTKPHTPFTLEKISRSCQVTLEGQATPLILDKHGFLKKEMKHEYCWIDQSTLGVLERTSLSFTNFRISVEVLKLNQKQLKHEVSFKFSEPLLEDCFKCLIFSCVERNLKYLAQYNLAYFESMPSGTLVDYAQWGQIVPRRLNHSSAFYLSVQKVFRNQEERPYLFCKIIDGISFHSENTLERFITWKVITETVNKFSEVLNIKIN